MSITIDVLTRSIENVIGLPKERVKGISKLNDLAIDSLDYVELVMEIEDLADVEFSDERLENVELQKLSTVNDLHQELNKILSKNIDESCQRAE